MINSKDIMIPMLIVFVILIINFIVALLFARTSNKKGYYGIVTGIMTMFLGIPGMLYAIALPEKKVKTDLDKKEITLTVVITIILCVQILCSAFIAKKVANALNNTYEIHLQQDEESDQKRNSIQEKLDELENKLANDEISIEEYSQKAKEIESLLN